jgi:hypothetical protein
MFRIVVGTRIMYNEITLLTKAAEEVSKTANGSSLIILFDKKIRFNKANIDVMLIELSIGLVSSLLRQLIYIKFFLIALIKFFILLYIWDGFEELS